jgi:hypothetical protein
VRTTFIINRDTHARQIALTSLLSGQQCMNALPVADVLKVLNDRTITFILIGAHGLAGWRDEARATEEVDVLVMTRHHKKAVAAFTEAYPELAVEKHEVVVRLRNRTTNKVAIDLIKTIEPLLRVAFKHAQTTTVQRQACLVPTLEMALAMKFAAMISLTREDHKKFMDAADFTRMVKVNADIGLDTLAELGDLVFPGGGQEIVTKVRQIRAGERLQL